MSRVTDHLRSPQPGDSEATKGGAFGLGLVLGPGKPRWLGYGFFLAGFILGAVLLLGVVDVGGDIGLDLVRIIGAVGMLGAVLGALEVYRGQRIWKR